MQPSRWSLAIAAVVVSSVIGWMFASRRRCFRSVCNLIYNAAVAVNLKPVRVRLAAAAAAAASRHSRVPSEEELVHEDPQPSLQ
jgi:hypothetical protein